MRKVLAVQPFGIGDSLFLTPLLRGLKQQAKVERLDLLLGSRTREVYQNNPFVDDIYVFDRDRFKAQSALQKIREISDLILKLRKTDYDVLVDCSLSRQYALFGWLGAGIGERVGFNHKKRGIFLTRKVDLTAGFSRRHVLEYYADLAHLMGFSITERKPDYFLTGEDQLQAEAALDREGLLPRAWYAVVTPGGGESWGKDAGFKRWATTYFAEALNKMQEQVPFEAVVFLGSGQEAELAESVERDFKGKAVNLCGKISLGASAAVLKRAAFLLANDSGMVHMARALEVPIVALYGPVDAGCYGPFPKGPQYVAIGREDLECRPCYKGFRYNSACVMRECLTELYPQDVLRRIRDAGFVDIVRERMSKDPQSQLN